MIPGFGLEKGMSPARREGFRIEVTIYKTVIVGGGCSMEVLKFREGICTRIMVISRLGKG
jgi:hypothetical protein